MKTFEEMKKLCKTARTAKMIPGYFSQQKRFRAARSIGVNLQTQTLAGAKNKISNTNVNVNIFI
jgi:hypothetical protein